jgi:hypothetical protein
MDELTRDELNELCEAAADAYCKAGDCCASCEAGMQIKHSADQQKQNRSDHINGGFEIVGGFFTLLHVWRIWSDKSVAGCSVLAVTFFTLWGYWNLYYYKSIKQPWSLAATYFITATNTVWLALLIYYSYF